MTDPFELFKRDPKVDARILDSVMPSDYFPKRGEYFRVRNATIADRSYMGDIWVCIDSQNYCAAGKRVLDSYGGLNSQRIGDVMSFVAGDVIFYDCTQLWDSIIADAMESQAKKAAESAETSQS